MHLLFLDESGRALRRLRAGDASLRVTMSPEDALERLDAFVGECDMTTSFAPDPATAPRARTTFEWLSGRRFLVQRWEVDLPGSPGRHRDHRPPPGA